MPIDYSDPAIRVLVGMTCGPNFPMPEGGEREVRDECEVMAIALGGAVSEYCGCPCKHSEDPVCDPASPPEVRMSRLPSSFTELGEELRQILTSTDPEMQDYSFAARFGYCADEIPNAYERIMTLHEYTPPRDPETCRPEIAIDEDLFNTPAGLWLYLPVKLGTLPYDTFQQPWVVGIGLGGQAANGFYGIAGGAFSFMAPENETNLSGDGAANSSSVLGAAFNLETGYYFPVSSSFGIRLFLDFDIGGNWAEGRVRVAPNDTRDDIDAFRVGLGPGLKMIMWFMEGFTMGLGLEYNAIVTETALPVHSLLFGMDLGFRLTDF